MNFSQKAKYLAIGGIASFALIPLALKAVETIPITFREGDVISATVINTLLGRINDVQRGFVDASEFEGAWSCTTYSTNSDGCTPAGNLMFKKTGSLTFNSTNKTFNYSGTGDPRGCFTGGYLTSGHYDVQGGFLVTDYGVYEARKRGPGEFLWTLNSANPPNGYTVCSKLNAAPAPADALSVTVNSKDVTLAWVNNNANDTEFRVERKSSVTGAWETLATSAANATSYSDVRLTVGTYWYRVIATNVNGDAISSSEVQATIQ